jgi:hypothetical protein
MVMPRRGVCRNPVLTRPPADLQLLTKRRRRPRRARSGIPYSAVLALSGECCIRCNSAPFGEGPADMTQGHGSAGRATRRSAGAVPDGRKLHRRRGVPLGQTKTKPRSPAPRSVRDASAVPAPGQPGTRLSGDPPSGFRTQPGRCSPGASRPARPSAYSRKLPAGPAPGTGPGLHQRSRIRRQRHNLAHRRFLLARAVDSAWTATDDQIIRFHQLAALVLREVAAQHNQLSRAA